MVILVNPTQSLALRAASHHLVTSPQRGKDTKVSSTRTVNVRSNTEQRVRERESRNMGTNHQPIPGQKPMVANNTRVDWGGRGGPAWRLRPIPAAPGSCGAQDPLQREEGVRQAVGQVLGPGRMVQLCREKRGEGKSSRDVLRRPGPWGMGGGSALRCCSTCFHTCCSCSVLSRGGLLGVAGRLSGTVSPFRAEQGTSLETPSRARASSCQAVVYHIHLWISECPPAPQCVPRGQRPSRGGMGPLGLCFLSAQNPVCGAGLVATMARLQKNENKKSLPWDFPGKSTGVGCH